MIYEYGFVVIQCKWNIRLVHWFNPYQSQQMVGDKVLWFNKTNPQ